MAYIEANCILKGDDKLTNQSFTNWLNTVLLPECFMRDDGLFSNSLTPSLSMKLLRLCHSCLIVVLLPTVEFILCLR
jgi:hypothetical protein